MCAGKVDRTFRVGNCDDRQVQSEYVAAEMDGATIKLAMHKILDLNILNMK